MAWTFQSDILFSASFTPSSTPSLTASFQLVGANIDRKMLSVFNSSDANVYLSFGVNAATTTFFTVRMPQNSLYELPNPVWNGAIQAICDATGSAGVVTVFDQA